MNDEPAYDTAPDLMSESAALVRLSHDRADRAGTDTELTDQNEREFLLRRAALADRFAIEQPDEDLYATDAATTARRLVDFDRQHPHLASGGPIDPNARLYVRQEYAACSH